MRRGLANFSSNKKCTRTQVQNKTDCFFIDSLDLEGLGISSLVLIKPVKRAEKMFLGNIASKRPKTLFTQ